MRRFLPLVVAALASSALAAPPLPSIVGPRNDAWAGPDTEFVIAQVGSPTLTATFTHFEVEVFTDAGLVTSFWCSNSVGSSARYCTAPVLDAGDYAWHARTLDGGERSAWTGDEAFRWDDGNPDSPAFLTVDFVDGGAVGLSWPDAGDARSGTQEYHWTVSRLPFDAGQDLGYSGSTTTGNARTAWVGPGDWVFGVHTHDFAENSSFATSAEAGPVRVPVDPLLPRPSAPVWVQGDGGFFMPASSTTAFRWDSPTDGGRFVLAQRVMLRDGGLEPLAIRLNTSQRQATASQGSEGFYQLLVAQAVESQVSDWSPPTTFMVDTRDPSSPRPLVATVDGGEVHLAWPEVNDTGLYRSGVAEYRLTRCCTADAAVTLGAFPAVSPDASVATVDLPGPGAWRYEVRAYDVAGNDSTPGTAVVSVLTPPTLAAPVTTPAGVSTGPVQVSWEDGGPGVVYDVQRLPEGVVTGALVVQATPAQAFTDAPPDGRWQYVVRGNLPPQTGVWSPPSPPVLVDTTPPAAALTARRQSAREVVLDWTAVDTGSGLAAVTLERETAGVVFPLGAVTQSPVLETPPDGSHRYRAVAVDVAGLRADTAWSPAVVTPGPVVAIDAVPPVQVTCGAPLEVGLTASGDGPVTWALVDGPRGLSLDAQTGALSWTPARSDVGAKVARVRAMAPASVAEVDVAIEVACAPRQLGLGCGCGSGGELAVALAALAALAGLGRRRRRGA